MSTMVSSPGSKITNVVYFVFGVSFGLFVIRYFFSDLLSDIRAVVALCSVIASLLGTLLYYLHPERRVEDSIVNSVYTTHGTSMERFIVMKRLLYQVWRVAFDERWETPQQEAMAALRSTVRGNDLEEEVWRRKGAIYFVLGSFLLLLSVPLHIIRAFELTVLLGFIILFAVLYGVEDFENLCRSISLFRFLEETHSMTSARHPKKPPYIQGPGSRYLVLDVFRPILNDLAIILEQRDWIRFQRRFQMVEEELELHTRQAESELHHYYIGTLFSVHLSSNQVERDLNVVQTQTVCNVLTEVSEKSGSSRDTTLATMISLVEQYLENPNSLLAMVDQLDYLVDHVEDCHELLKTIVNDHPELITKDTVEIIRRFYLTNRQQFQEILIKGTTLLDNDEEIERTLEVVLEDPYNIWRDITPRIVRVLCNMKGPKVLNAQIEVFRTRNLELVHEMFKHANLTEPGIAREIILMLDHHEVRSSIVSLVRKIITGKKSTFEVILPLLLNDNDENVRYLTLQVLSEIVDEGLKKVHKERVFLKSSLCAEDESKRIRRAVLDIAISIGINRSYNLIMQMATNDSEQDIREHAASYLLDNNE